MKKTDNGTGKTFIIYLILVLIIYLSVKFFMNPIYNTKPATVNDFIEDVSGGKVAEIEQEGNTIKYRLKDKKSFYLELSPEIWQSVYNENIKDRVKSNEIKLSIKVPQSNSSFTAILVMILGTVILFAAMRFFLRGIERGTGGASQGQNFGKSRARESKTVNGKIVKFDDVAGLVEEKEELSEIVDFLKNPQKYIKLGARIPSGVLLVGPPGTGKTYLSKAVAGEAGVPFFTISGSDFVEMYVGVGASRVRDLFQVAKKNAPCIVFIDEIDAVGRQRGAGLGGGNDEREQTLNQLLVEMDGFSPNEGIIVMAATNRPDILDNALLRPGRFDRTVYVGVPDVKGREAILKIHGANKIFEDNVDFKDIAKRTQGFTPADLENLLNEAALLTARENLSKIPMRIIIEASIKVMAGPEKKSQNVIEKERKIVAYHEAGHAIVSHFTDDLYPVNMITIVPRGRAGGFTAYLPDEEFSYITKTMIKNQIISLLGGRTAEEIIFHDISTGASNDIDRATSIARSMVTKFGMSDKLGPINYDSEGEEVFIGRDYGKTRAYSDKIQYEIDIEVKDIISDAHEKAKAVLNEQIDKLHKLASALLEKETIHREEFLELMKG